MLESVHHRSRKSISWKQDRKYKRGAISWRTKLLWSISSSMKPIFMSLSIPLGNNWLSQTHHKKCTAHQIHTHTCMHTHTYLTLSGQYLITFFPFQVSHHIWGWGGILIKANINSMAMKWLLCKLKTRILRLQIFRCCKNYFWKKWLYLWAQQGGQWKDCECSCLFWKENKASIPTFLEHVFKETYQIIPRLNLNSTYIDNFSVPATKWGTGSMKIRRYFV